MSSERGNTRFATIFFDLEDKYGSHLPTHPDLDKTVDSITRVLRSFDVRAVFNICGKVMEEKPGVVQELYSGGHEIASHGWAHENFLTLTPEELFSVLSRTEAAFKDTVGDKLHGIRPPGLLSRTSGDTASSRPPSMVLKQISERGYEWISFRKIVFAEEWMTFLRSSEAATQIPRLRRLVLSAKVSLQERLFSRTPRIRNKILDIPLTSSMDCDILGLPAPAEPSTRERVDTLIWCLKQQFERSGAYFNLNFHEWIIGSANRPIILQETLDFMKKHSKCEWILASDVVERTRA